MSYSAAVLRVKTINVPGTSGTINASVINVPNGTVTTKNLNNSNLAIVGNNLTVGGALNVSGNIESVINNDLAVQRDAFSVSSTIKGSRKIAKSPFHYPETTGKYAVDIHNVVQWVQTESCFATAKNRSSAAVYAIYVAKFGEAKSVSDYITPDGSGYTVPTKYGPKRITLSQGTCFYDASKQVFLTPPTPLNMTIMMPSTRDKNQEFLMFDSSPTTNYYPSTVACGNLDQLMYGTSSAPFTGVTAGSSGLRIQFQNDLAADSIINLFTNYDFTAWTNADIPMTYAGVVTADQIRSAQTLQRNSPSFTNRKALITRVMNVFVHVTQALTVRQQALLAAIKATGSYQRLLSYKWNAKVHKTYTDVSGVLSTDISQTQLPSGKRPIHFFESFDIFSMMEVASRGIIAVLYNHVYSSASSRVPYGSTAPYLSLSGGIQTFSHIRMDIEPGIGVDWTSKRTASFYPFNFDNLYNMETANPGVGTSIITTGNYCTGANSIIYNIEMFRTLYDKLIASGFNSFTDFTKVSTQGYSGTGVSLVAASIIMEKYPTFPMRFTCGITTDTALSLPWNLTDSSNNNYGGYFGSGTEEMLPNGWNIPVIYCDQNHGNYAKNDLDNVYVGFSPEIQTAFRKTLISIRADCMYHEFGDVHTGGELENSLYRSPIINSIAPRSEGIYYPDDAYNNMVFNHNLVSLENEFIMEWVRFAASVGMYVSRFGLPDTPFSKETIKQILPGTTTIAPYTLDDAAQHMLNVVVQESVQLPKVIKTFDGSIVDLAFKSSTHFNTFVNVADIQSLNTLFKIKDVPSGYIQELIVTGHNLIYDQNEHNVYDTNTPNRTEVYNFDSSNNVIPIDCPVSSGANWNIKDVNGVKWFVSGNIEPVLNTNPDSTLGESVAPGHRSNIKMILKLPPGMLNGKISFDYKVSSEPGWDFVKIYINDGLVIQKSGVLSDPQTMSSLFSFTSSLLKAGDELSIVYAKDELISLGYDVAFVNNITVSGYSTNYPASQQLILANTSPKLNFKMNNEFLLENTSIETLNNVLFTNIFTDKTMISDLKLAFLENVCVSGYVSVYMKILSLPNDFGKAELEIA